MLVVGAGVTGVQVASIFNAYGSRIQLFQTADASCRVRMKMYRQQLRRRSAKSGIEVHETSAPSIFEKTPTGVRMIFSKNGDRDSPEADTCGRGGGLAGRY